MMDELAGIEPPGLSTALRASNAVHDPGVLAMRTTGSFAGPALPPSALDVVGLGSDLLLAKTQRGSIFEVGPLSVDEPGFLPAVLALRGESCASARITSRTLTVRALVLVGDPRGLL